jgi:hypothetical protein
VVALTTLELELELFLKLGGAAAQAQGSYDTLPPKPKLTFWAEGPSYIDSTLSLQASAPRPWCWLACLLLHSLSFLLISLPSHITLTALFSDCRKDKDASLFESLT